jgi:hypothetical protein
MGLRSTVVLDPEFKVGDAVGASGTPSGVLVDADGNIASAPLIGELEVMEVLRGGQPAEPAAS